jgi:hypothetical protein
VWDITKPAVFIKQHLKYFLAPEPQSVSLLKKNILNSKRLAIDPTYEVEQVFTKSSITDAAQNCM